MDIPYGTSSLLDEHQPKRIKSRSVRGSASPTWRRWRAPVTPPRGPPQHFGAGPCFLNLPGKDGLTTATTTVSQTRRRIAARAPFSCRTRPRSPNRGPRLHCPFGENRGGGRGDSSRRRHPRRERRRPRPAGHSCFYHSPTRSPHTTRGEDDDSKSENNNNKNNNSGTNSDWSSIVK